MTTTTKLPDLTGTEKQVTWALDIRAKKFAWLDDMLTGVNDTDHNRTAIQAAKRVLLQKTEAKFWIDNCRTPASKLIVKNGLQDDLKAEFARLIVDEYVVSVEAQDIAVAAEIELATATNTNDEHDQTVQIDNRKLQDTLAQISRAVKLSKFTSSQKNRDAVYFAATDSNVKIFTCGARFDACRTIKAHGTCHNVNFALTFKAAAMIEKSLKQLIYNNKFTTTTFEYAKDVATVRFARGLSFDLATIPTTSTCTADFPAVTLDDSASTIVLAQSELKALLNSTLYAVDDKDYGSPIFNTVNLKTDSKDSTLTLTATDRHQLATATTDKVNGDEFTCNIFGDALKFILPLLNGNDAVTITTTEHRTKFAFGEWLIVACNYTDEEFPDCSEILSGSTPVTAVIKNDYRGSGRKHLIETIKLIAQVADENGAIELIFSQSDLTIQSAREKIGSARRCLEALTFGVENGTARGKFNAKYLLNMLSHAEDTNIKFSLSAKAISIHTDNTTAVSIALKNSVELPKMPKSDLVLENVA